MAKPRKTPTAEQKQWMKENGYNEAQMDAFWNDCMETNWKIRNIDRAGMSWRDMNLSAVMELPTQKERDLAAAAEKEAKELAEKEAEEQKKREKEYYEQHFEEVMFNKIAGGEKLTEKEIRRLVWDFEVERIDGYDRRWTRSVQTIVELCGRFFSIDWEEGLTECQENEYYNQPVEVVKHQYEKTITVTEWKPV